MLSKVMTTLLALALALMWAGSAVASHSPGEYPLSGNARFQIGNGLPIPITFQPPPNDKVLVKPNVRAVQSGVDPMALSLPQSALTYDGNAFNLPVFKSNSKVFQVNTNVDIFFPGAAAKFSAGKRTGAGTMKICPGQIPATPDANPNCNNPGSANHPVGGFWRYTATKDAFNNPIKFGGPMQGAVGGTADVAVVAAVPSPSPPTFTDAVPCDHITRPPCRVIFALATPQATGAQGGPFGFVAASAGGAPPAPGGLRNAKVNNVGVVLSVTSPGLGSGLANPVESWGAPWTVGKLTINQSENNGATSEIFVIEGSDQRVNGVGSISLVSGSLSDRALTGPNANRGWLNLVLGVEIHDTPGLSTWGVGILSLLLAGGAMWRVRRTATA